MSIINPLPFNLQNGNKADASQVMADLNQIRNDVNNNCLSTAIITTDGTLSADSDSLIPTEKAVKTYVDNNSSSGIISAVTKLGLTADGQSISLPAYAAPISYALVATTDDAPSGANLVLNDGINNITIGGAALSPITNALQFADIGGWLVQTSEDTINITCANWNSSNLNLILYYIIIPH